MMDECVEDVSRKRKTQIKKQQCEQENDSGARQGNELKK